MNKTIPLFPLKLVAFPGEQLNLHIFEERYKQLVADAQEQEGIFGICVYLDKIMPIGTELRLEKIVKKYEDGRMDIQSLALRTFEVVTFENPLSGHLYAGGTVKIRNNDPKVSSELKAEYLSNLLQLFDVMDYNVEMLPSTIDSFTYAHKIGLKIEEEYELLLLLKEEERLKYINRHLNKIITIMKNLEEAKRKIKLNGHFKLLDPLDF